MSATSQYGREPGDVRTQVGGQRIEQLGVAGQADDGGPGPGEVAAQLGAQARRGAR